MKKITIVFGFILTIYFITVLPEAPTQEEIDANCNKVLLDEYTFICQ